MTARLWEPGDPELVTLATAKTHLRITASDQDRRPAETFGRERVDPRLPQRPKRSDLDRRDECTPFIASAVLLLLAHTYEHRGDELARRKTTTRVWEAVANLLRRWRDPALA